jgi:GNAT superfamily N-acetyltransferase
MDVSAKATGLEGMMLWRDLYRLEMGCQITHDSIHTPYSDIYMEVAEPFRGRGLGSFLVQELKRVCHEGGHVPAARCSPANVASRWTLQQAGFVPCGHILTGSVRPDPRRDR